MRDDIASNTCTEPNNRYNKTMNRKKLRKFLLWAGVIVLAFSLAALIYALQSNPVQLEQFLLDGALFTSPGGLP
jgi:hypothetical protein